MSTTPGLKIPGFSVLELLITLLIIALFVFTMPLAMGTFQIKNKLLIVENDIIQGLDYARQQAYLRHEILVLKPYNKQWAKGMQLLTKDGLVIRQWEWRYNALNLNWQGLESADKISFYPEIGRNTSSGHFDLYVNSASPVKIIVNRLGRSKVL